MPQFELFKESRRPVPARPTVTVQRTGRFSLNDAAATALGRPKDVHLLFDRENRVIGIRAARADAPHARHLNRQSKGSMYQISAAMFCEHYGIPVGPAGKRYSAYVDGDILCIDLNQEPEDIMGPRNPARKGRAGPLGDHAEAQNERARDGF